jgi:GLPGLI family protein
MARLFLVIAMSTALLLPCSGQGALKVKATYLSTLNLSSNPESLDKQSCELLIKGPRSLFLYQPPPADSSAGNAAVGTDNFGSPTVEMRVSTKDSINERYYIDHLQQQLISREFVFENGKGSPYIVREDLKRIPWVLVNEFREIGNFRCQKATGRFRGRTYTAWFAARVPVHSGPWKLHGLPGLILEAFDEWKTGKPPGIRRRTGENGDQL